MAGPGKPGRKTKLTPELHQELVRRVRDGSFVGVAARACGISRDAWQRWQRRGREEGEGIYADLVADMEEASAVAESAALAKLLSLAGSKERTQWQALAWFLERRFPSRWAKRSDRSPSKPEGAKSEAPVWFEPPEEGS
jgi:transposase